MDVEVGHSPQKDDLAISRVHRYLAKFSGTMNAWQAVSVDTANEMGLAWKQFMAESRTNSGTEHANPAEVAIKIFFDLPKREGFQYMRNWTEYDKARVEGAIEAALLIGS
jgi:hypothetical protein